MLRSLSHPRHREYKVQSIAVGVQANQLSGEVAHAKATVRDHEASFPVGEIDEEDPELKVAREKLRAIKDGARGAHEAYARHGAEAEEMLDTVAEARRRLMDAFEAWFEDEGAFLGEVRSSYHYYLGQRQVSTIGSLAQCQ